MTNAIVKGILVGLFMAISVGPTLFVIIRYSLNYSYKSGLAFVLGVSLSDFIYVALANVAAPLLNGLKPYERYIAFAGAMSTRTCEVCGAPGESRNIGWVKTLCDTHAKEKEDKEAEFFHKPKKSEVKLSDE